MEFNELQKRLENLINTFDRNTYPELYELISYTISMDCHFTKNVQFWTNALFSDQIHQLPTTIADFLLELLNDEIQKMNDEAMCDLGSLYYTGRIGEQNFEKAVYYYEMASKLGNREAQENLGYCYYYGRLGEVDYKKAYHYFIKGALDKHIVSLYKIGDMYKNGYYVEKDEKEAFIIYSECKRIIDEKKEEELEAAIGSDVYIRLADCFYNGTGTDKDLELALEYYQKAEINYLPRIKEGDFMYRKQYFKSIEMQEKIREILHEDLPSFDWVKTEF